ncbi:DDB1-and CUL4-associated factor 5 OS=Mus musculus GN=Dcaf5 PE=1 SV=2 [Rhizoctonia solani AG-1 IB]|uniref:DDB1-and CUL4-associated factor 5 n=1 Tax=Thanatephorus cucumeris (strain AG1-IB / isolate 7/3/14) TaxID=1108050 RepID=A0A0B7F768_THACB|nr:DDB1-and CUL4-associated factor 5 OS=Mus musculus GN=Dcaf5 PE=1 SV=2 [Rhizoctonia solani AG-1 IB]
MYGHHSSPLYARHKREQFLLNMLSGGFKYSKSISAHTNCVNAIGFSKPAGRWMASAGDDTNLFLWDTFQDDFHVSPTPAFRLATEARKNVLALAFNASNDKIYSVGTHSQLVEYDISRQVSGQNHPATFASQGPQIARSDEGDRIQHMREYGREDTIYSVSTHPTHPNLVMTAGEEGLVRLHDLRSPGTTFPSMEGFVVRNSEINDAQWCPAPDASHSFIVAQRNGDVCLLDSRMAFSTSINPAENPENVIHRYATWVAKVGSNSCWGPEPSSVAFSSDGMRIAITLKDFTPVLYDTFNVAPLTQLCAFLGNADSPRVGSYSNSCTVKHGSFGGAGLGLPEDYCAGSDDFKVYAWTIPSRDAMERTVHHRQSNQWLSETDASHVGFVSPDNPHRVAIPSRPRQPNFILGGHRSIVNTAAFHPVLPLIFTSGVESHVQMHSVRPLPGGRLSEPAELSRSLPPSSLLSRISFRAAAYGVDSLSREEIQLYREIPREDRTIFMFDEYECSQYAK